MNQLLSSKIQLLKWARFRHGLHNVTVFFFFFFISFFFFLGLILPDYFSYSAGWKSEHPTKNIIMDNKSFFCFKYYIMTNKEIFADQGSD